ncbi:hypothetical protein [Intestinibacter bartlettii]|uniref:Uncharacterized protein n=1 Tax=Intestinibacter bartlettii TaxID=261299 RepID=A0ABS6E110_9FIRM|nr:hypothetical protein [Intestinibacter bartlettii]MBU5337308.1 hypothetical protein [Intestinibacter bartlettii]MDO5010593.1 hypothetical protein [Intestinibacter bartlettii]
MKNNKNKSILKMTLVLQTLYLIVIFLSGIFPDIYVAFWISAALNILSLFLNLANMFSKGNFKFLLLLITICEILLTVFIFLLPEAGVPAPVKLF